jgi:hypothetical protein
MLVDIKHYFSEAQAITTSKISDNIIDLGAMGQAGAGSQVFINVYVDTAFSSDTETMDIWLVTSSAAVTVGGTKVLNLKNAIAVDSISGLHEAGKLVKVPLPSLGLSTYIGLAYIATTALATGKLTAFLSYE